MDTSTSNLFMKLQIKIRNKFASNNFKRKPYSKVEFCYATDHEKKIISYKIRYSSYFSHGYIPINPDRLWYDKFDSMDSTKIILVSNESHYFATIRFCTSYTSEKISQIPSLEIFDLDYQKLKNLFPSSKGLYDHYKITEISKFAISINYQMKNDAIFSVYNASVKVIEEINPDVIIISVRKNHINFYKKMGFLIINEEKYFKKDNVWLSLMGCSAQHFKLIEITENYTI